MSTARCMYRNSTLVAALAGALVISAAASAQAQTSVPPAQGSPIDQDKQRNLSDAHSVLQKTGLVTLGLTGLSGAALLANQETAFGAGRCNDGNPVFGEFGCTGLKYVHFGFGATTLGLFIATEIVAAEMPVSPYDMGDSTKQGAMKTLRVANIGLFAVQPVLGLLAANHGAFGMSAGTAKVLRTVHFAVGGTVASTYTANAALQW